MLIWFSEAWSSWKPLELDYYVSSGSKGLLKKIQIETHRISELERLETIESYFPNGLKRPRDWPKATERIWAF